MIDPAHTHGSGELCAQGADLYARALSEGGLLQQDMSAWACRGAVSCVIEAGLLEPDVVDGGRLLPVPPAVALPRMLRTIEDGIAEQRRREERLAEAFAPLMTLGMPSSPLGDGTVTLHEGPERISAAIIAAGAQACEEILTIQWGKRNSLDLEAALAAERPVLTRGGRMRLLCQHTTRHSPAISAHLEQLAAYDVEARTLDHLAERLVVFDRRVAFIPANEERTIGAELHHPAVVAYLVTMFQQLWQPAVPLFPHTASLPTTDGISARQRAVAELLVEGETDARIAERLDMNVRTCRAHIAKLAATLGSTSRAQLGYLIGKSGLIENPP